MNSGMADQLASLLDLLTACNLSHLRAPLQASTLASLIASLDDGRPALLKHLKDLEVAKLTDRQRLATELAKALKAGLLSLDRDVAPGPPEVEPISSPPAAPDAESGLRPALVCFYSGGMEPSGGRKLLMRWLAAARAFGLTDQLVLDHPTAEDGAVGTEAVSGYMERLVAETNQAFGETRPLLLLGHSLGGHEAFALAHRLGSPRVRKLYVLAVRPPDATPTVLEECFGGILTHEELAAKPREDFLRFVCQAWGNVLLEEFIDTPESAWPADTRATIDVMRQQYASPSVAKLLRLDSLPLDLPILAVAATLERPQGETSKKLQGWRRHTTASFRLATVEGDHFTIMQPGVGKGQGAQATPLYTLLLADMLGVEEGAIDGGLMMRAMREVNMEQVRKNREAAAAAKIAQVELQPRRAEPPTAAPIPEPQAPRPADEQGQGRGAPPPVVSLL